MKNFLLSIFILVVFLPGGIQAQEEERQEIIEEVKPRNNECLECHGQDKYTYFNEQLGRDVKAQMCEDYIVSEEEYYQANHFSFACVDCHSSGFNEYPHPAEARFEQVYSCTDCHGFSESDEKYQFSKIEESYKESVHHKRLGEDFSCWSCHDPHTYAIKARESNNIKNIVSYNNSMCLDCHSDVEKFEMLSGEKKNVFEHHEWLPNQNLHFNNVRCIECHTEVNKDILVAHKVQPKKEAVRKCVECHSENSLLLSTLYKYKVQENRQKNGFYNGVILNESYVIGASRNEYLNVISIVLFFAALGGILVHSLLRYFFVKK